MNWKKYIVENYLGKKNTAYNNAKEELKLKIYNDFLSDDLSRILSASKILIHLDNLPFDSDEISLIGSRCKNLPKSSISITRDYRKDINIALKVLENFENGENCKCKVYNEWIHFLPEREIEMGFLIKTKDPIFYNDLYEIEHYLKCLKCGSDWSCTENQSYHYPTYNGC